jgi:HEAT repeat protein
MSAAEVGQQLRRLLAPSGDPAYRRVRGEALAWLLDHAESAYPELLSIVDTDDPPVLAIEALPLFRRAESVPVLERLLHSAEEPTVVVVAQALADHDQPAAATVLSKALGSPRDQVVASAADGLAHRGDPAACGVLAQALRHPDPEVRERIQTALTTLGC